MLEVDLTVGHQPVLLQELTVNRSQVQVKHIRPAVRQLAAVAEVRADVEVEADLGAATAAEAARETRSAREAVKEAQPGAATVGRAATAVDGAQNVHGGEVWWACGIGLGPVVLLIQDVEDPARGDIGLGRFIGEDGDCDHRGRDLQEGDWKGRSGGPATVVAVTRRNEGHLQAGLRGSKWHRRTVRALGDGDTVADDAAGAAASDGCCLAWEWHDGWFTLINEERCSWVSYEKESKLIILKTCSQGYL